MSESVIDKESLRRAMKIQRKTVSARQCEEISCLLRKTVVSWYQYRQAETVMLYAPIGRELDVLSLARSGDKRFVLPRMIDDSAMEAAPYAWGDPLETGPYGFAAPLSAPVSIEQIDLVLVPALACDGDGFRLGYGKGCYDRFLSQHGFDGVCAAVVYDFARVPSVFAQKHDVKMDYCVTPEKIYPTISNREGEVRL